MFLALVAIVWFYCSPLINLFTNMLLGTWNFEIVASKDWMTFKVVLIPSRKRREGFIHMLLYHNYERDLLRFKPSKESKHKFLDLLGPFPLSFFKIILMIDLGFVLIPIKTKYIIVAINVPT